MEHLLVFKYYYHGQKKKCPLICSYTPNCSAVTQIVLQRAASEKKITVETGAAGAQRVNAAGSLRLSGKAQVFGKRCTNEWNLQ